MKKRVAMLVMMSMLVGLTACGGNKGARTALQHPLPRVRRRQPKLQSLPQAQSLLHPKLRVV